MRALILAAALLVVPALGHAQGNTVPAASRYPALGYAGFGVGVCNHGALNLSVGGGGEAFVSRNVTVGGDVSYHTFSDFDYVHATGIVGYHLTDRMKGSRTDPFVSGGVGVAAADGTVFAGSVGGGVNYWIKPRVGIRPEGRVYFDEGETVVAFRIGFSFR